MPFKSEQQRKAMYAAASGHSNIGIPKSVGEKFVKHKDDNDLEWLDELLLKEMEVNLLKGDEAPQLLTPEAHIDLSHELQKIQIKDIGDKLRQIAQHINGIKSDEIIVKLGNEEDKVPENDCKEDSVETVPEEPSIVEPVANDAGARGRCAGIMFVTKDEEILLIRRGNGGDYPQTWAVPGGHQDEKDADLESAARRECKEETRNDARPRSPAPAG